MTREIDVPSVGPNEVLVVQGGSSSIRVHGDVGEGARLTAQGGGATIVVDGYVHAHASLIAQGGGAKVIVKGGKHATARTKAQGGGSEVIVNGRRSPQPPPGPGAWSPPRPPKPPRMPFWDSDSVNQVTRTGRNSVSVQAAGSVRIVNDRIWIDGQEITEIAEAIIDPPDDEPKNAFTIEKSGRPRELWGT